MDQTTQDKSEKNGCLQKLGCLFSVTVVIFVLSFIVFASLVAGGIAGWLGAGSGQGIVGALTGGVLAAGLALLLGLIVLGPLEKHLASIKYPHTSLVLVMSFILIGMLSGGTGGLVSSLLFNGSPKSGLVAGIAIGGLLCAIASGKLLGETH